MLRPIAHLSTKLNTPIHVIHGLIRRDSGCAARALRWGAVGDGRIGSIGMLGVLSLCASLSSRAAILLSLFASLKLAPAATRP